MYRLAATGERRPHSYTIILLVYIHVRILIHETSRLETHGKQLLTQCWLSSLCLACFPQLYILHDEESQSALEMLHNKVLPAYHHLPTILMINSFQYRVAISLCLMLPYTWLFAICHVYMSLHEITTFSPCPPINLALGTGW